MNQSTFRNPQSPIRNRAFSLVEILIVIGIIVLMVGLAIPAFNAISGSRSIDSAGNTISAFVGRARLEAIGLQETRGVFFFIDPVSQDTKVAIVKEAPRPAIDATDKGMAAATIDLYLDLASDKDYLTLPSGVGVQVVDDCAFSGVSRTDDGFLGFNGSYPDLGTPFYYQSGGGNATNATVVTTPAQALSTRIGGVILFDAQGRLVCKSYAFKTRENTGGGTFKLTAMGRRLFTINNTEIEETARTPSVSSVADVIPWQQVGAGAPKAVRSQVGFVLFDKPTFEAKGFSVTDPQLNNLAYASETTESDNTSGEERWLDENATVYLINRYNGTLVKGE